MKPLIINNSAPTTYPPSQAAFCLEAQYNPVHKRALKIQINGTILSIAFLFVKIPNVNKPNNGPYVMPAMSKTVKTNDWSLDSENNITTTYKITAKPACMLSLNFLFCSASS